MSWEAAISVSRSHHVPRSSSSGNRRECSTLNRRDRKCQSKPPLFQCCASTFSPSSFQMVPLRLPTMIDGVEARREHSCVWRLEHATAERSDKTKDEHAGKTASTVVQDTLHASTLGAAERCNIKPFHFSHQRSGVQIRNLRPPIWRKIKPGWRNRFQPLRGPSSARLPEPR